MKSAHKPVLVETLRVLLNLKPGDNAIDATLDGGGHAKMMLDLVRPSGKVLGIDQDTKMIKPMSGIKNLTAVPGNFSDIGKIAKQNNFINVKAVLFDLGMSTLHLKESGRGFSFNNLDEPILMNLNPENQRTAALILNSNSADELFRIFRDFGEEPRAGSIARKIVNARKKKRIVSVADLLNALDIREIRGKEKQLARIFQALRIAVNEELPALRLGLEKSFDLLASGGRIAVISYHSLEDRIVKIFFKAQNDANLASLISKKPITPAFEEISKNPSSRSAKLRILQKL